MKCKEDRERSGGISSGKLAKLIITGFILSVFALAPLISNFLPDGVNYDESYQSITLKPGLNQLGDLDLTIGNDGRVLRAEKPNSRITNRFFGFRNKRSFTASGVPFISLLSFCCFFIWYDRHRKEAHARKLKKVVLGSFLFTALWFIYRYTIPDPNSNLGFEVLYYACIHIVTALSLMLGYHLYNRYTSRKRTSKPHSSKPNPVPSLVSYMFEVREKHYYRAIAKAMENVDDYEKRCRELREYEQRTFEEFNKINANYKSNYHGTKS